MQFLTGIANALRRTVGLILPAFAKAGDFRNWNPWVWRILHLLLLAAILVGLWWLNNVFEIPRYLPNVSELLRKVFLPILFLLLYALSWMGYWLWRLFGEDAAAADFTDVDEDWNAAVQKLDEAGIGLGDAPLFLVLGRPAGGDDPLFNAASVACDIRAPSRVGASLRVFANRDAIYVTCSDASAWGRFAAALAAETEETPAALPAHNPRETIDIFNLPLSDSLLGEMTELLNVQSTRPLKLGESDRLRVLADMANAPTESKRRVELGPDEAARGSQRLEFLCRLIRRDRRPWCPVNGILVLVPWAATESDDIARNASAVLQRDLAAARAALQLRFPILALVADLETARGFAEFRHGFPTESLKARVGQRLPLVPDLSIESAPALYERAVQWIGQTILPAGIIRFLRYDSGADPRTTPGGIAHNRNLYSLLREVYTRGPRLARVLSRGLAATAETAPDDQPLFGGCYLAGTGRQPAEQAFVHGVFQRLLENQNSVAWTREALEDDARYRRWTTFGYVGLTAIAAAAAVIAILFATPHKAS